MIKSKRFIIYTIIFTLSLSLYVWYIWINSFNQNCVPYQNKAYQTYVDKNQQTISIYNHRNNELLYYILSKSTSITAKGTNQLVAVIDLPISSHHEFASKIEFSDNIENNINLSITKDIILTDTQANPHGTEIVGLINGKTVGIAPHAMVRPIAINHTGYQDADTSIFTNATKLAIKDNVRIINHANTWGSELLFYGKTKSGDIFDPYDVLDHIISSQSILVLSAGNQGVDFTQEIDKIDHIYGNILNHQEILDHVLYVGVFDIKSNQIARFSNYPGNSINLQKRFITVPNIPLVSTDDNESYQDQLIGTSYASAVVSAALATLMGEDITLSAPNAADILLKTATVPCEKQYPECQSTFYGSGMLDLEAALNIVEKRKRDFWYPLYRSLTLSRLNYLCSISL